MNKLISKNPVQRFKQGRKIVKAQFGWNVRGDGVIVNSAGVPVRKENSGYRPYSMTQDASYQAMWPDDRQIAPGLYLEPGTNNVYASRAEEDGGPIGNLISKGPEPPANGTYYETTNASGKVVDRGRYFGGKKHSLPIGNSSNNKTKQEAQTSQKPAQQKSTTAQRNPGAYHNITNWQNKLRNFYEPGKFAVDGIWGKNTEAAYQKYLSLQNLSNVPGEKAKEGADLSNAPTTILNTTPNLNISPTFQAPQKIFNRAQVRDFIRSKGVGAYDFTGDQRKALRMVLNGQGTDADKALVQSMGLFKNGGTLPSRNAITRFKNRKFN